MPLLPLIFRGPSRRARDAAFLWGKTAAPAVLLAGRSAANTDIFVKPCCPCWKLHEFGSCQFASGSVFMVGIFAKYLPSNETPIPALRVRPLLDVSALFSGDNNLDPTNIYKYDVWWIKMVTNQSFVLRMTDSNKHSSTFHYPWFFGLQSGNTRWVLMGPHHFGSWFHLRVISQGLRLKPRRNVPYYREALVISDNWIMKCPYWCCGTVLMVIRNNNLFGLHMTMIVLAIVVSCIQLGIPSTVRDTGLPTLFRCSQVVPKRTWQRLVLRPGATS